MKCPLLCDHSVYSHALNNASQWLSIDQQIYVVTKSKYILSGQALNKIKSLVLTHTYQIEVLKNCVKVRSHLFAFRDLITHFA